MGKLLVLHFERFPMGFSQPEKLAYQNWAMCACAYGPISLNFELHHTCFIICSSCTHCKLSNAPLKTKFGVVVQELHSRKGFLPYVGITCGFGAHPKKTWTSTMLLQHEMVRFGLSIKVYKHKAFRGSLSCLFFLAS